MTSPGAPAGLQRPTVDTRFHIDYEWWRRADRDVEVYLQAYLCPDHQADLELGAAELGYDEVDPATGEVRRARGVEQVLMAHCARQPDYVGPHSSLVDAVFRILLANGNSPLSCSELGDRLGRPAQTLLRTLSAPRVYKGIRPILE